MLTIGKESSPPIEIDGGKEIWAVAFAANGEYIVGGGEGYGVGVWQVEDGKQMATLRHCGKSVTDFKSISAIYSCKCSLTLSACRLNFDALHNHSIVQFTR